VESSRPHSGFPASLAEGSLVTRKSAQRRIAAPSGKNHGAQENVEGTRQNTLIKSGKRKGKRPTAREAVTTGNDPDRSGHYMAPPTELMLKNLASKRGTSSSSFVRMRKKDDWESEGEAMSVTRRDISMLPVVLVPAILQGPRSM